MEQIVMKQKVIDVLMKNHNKNLFSSLHREQLAEEIVSKISGEYFTTDGVTDNGIVAKNGLTGTPINKPKSDESKTVAEKVKPKVVKDTKRKSKNLPVRKNPRQAPKENKKNLNQKSNVSKKINGSLNKLKNK